jgi:hypothetical protein
LFSSGEFFSRLSNGGSWCFLVSLLSRSNGSSNSLDQTVLTPIQSSP